MTLTKDHKIFLQALIQERTLNEEKSKAIVMKLFGHAQVSNIINHINEKLQILNMSIKGVQCEISGQLYWILTSTVIDNITRFQDEYSEAQLALLRSVFSEIITSGNGCVQSTTCLNLCSSLDVKLSKAEGQEFLTDAVKTNWLYYKDGHYYMGVRSITELMPYFKETYEGNLYTCCLCKQVIFHGEKCGKCQNLIHTFCLKKFARIHNPVKCPNCDSVFTIAKLHDTPSTEER